MSKGKTTFMALAVALLLPGAAFAQVDSWTGACANDDAFAAQGDILASLGSLLNLPTNWQDFDIDADSVPDAWQCQLLAYSLCSGNATATATQAANKAEVDGLITEFGTLVTYLGATNGALTTFAAQLSGAPSAAVCDNPASLAAAPPLDSYFAAAFPGFPTISSAYAYIGSAMSDSYNDYAPFPAVLGIIPDLLAAEGGLSTESGVVINGIVPVSDVATLNQALQILAGIAQFEQNCGTGAGDATLVANATTVLGAIGSGVVLNPLAFTVLDTGSKAAGEDFAGAGDYNGDSVTNSQVAGYVEGASGGANDFVAGATGELGDFWLGNPSLPVMGLFGLGAAVCGMSAAGALTLRRRK
jgi:hypothetical protein